MARLVKKAARKRRTARPAAFRAPSQRSHLAPTPRLVKRRRRTAAAPPGFFANPNARVPEYRGAVIAASNGKVFAVVIGGIIQALFTTQAEANKRLSLLTSRST